MNNIITINEVCDPIKPSKANTIAARCLTVLLDGGILNRKTLGQMGITVNNASLHSMVSILRNEQFIPIESNRLLDGTCNYYINPEEIVRYKNCDLRKQQYEEMRILIERRRQEKALKNFMRFLESLSEPPRLSRYIDHIPPGLIVIAEKINALLKIRKGVI